MLYCKQFYFYMQKKYFYGSLIGLIGIISVWQLANAQTWAGPKPNCSDPTKTDCNVDGVVWNRSNASIDTAPIQPGNFKISGRAEIGDDLKVNTTDKAIRVDQPGSSNFNIGNWAQTDPNAYVNLSIWGNVDLKKHGLAPDPKLSTPVLCLSGDCRTTWPAGGGGGGGTVTSVGSSNGLTGGPIVGDGALSIMSCGEGKILKTVGGVWACADDTDTNSGGTVTTISSPDTSINVINGSGPVTNLGLNTGLLDARYVNVGGDTMSGGLVVQGNLDGQLTNRFGWSGTLGDWLMNIMPAANTIATKGTITHTGAINSSGNIAVTGAGGKITSGTFCIGASCVSSWTTGDVTDVLGGSGITVTNGVGPQPTVKISNCGSNGQVMMWDAAGSAWACAMPVENIQLSGIGLTGGGAPNASGIVTVGLDNTYLNGRFVNKAGDTMTGGLTLSTGNLALTGAPGTNGNLFLPTTGGIGFNGSRSNTGFLQLWSDNIFYWDLGSADNLTIRNHNLAGTALQIKSGDLVVPNNKWGDGQATLAGCTFVAKNPAGGATQCSVGQFSAGISMNAAGTAVAGIYCCPL
ncbi:MAG: hypothetical protein PHC53_04205 [Patescibacteria group bacterium]|nr:hypothetical protein [Patescibacteria group bacterium]